MKLEIFQNQLQLENSQTEENRETEAKVEEVFKSLTHHSEVILLLLRVATTLSLHYSFND